jgi:hypothetical protein
MPAPYQHYPIWRDANDLLVAIEQVVRNLVVTTRAWQCLSKGVFPVLFSCLLLSFSHFSTSFPRRRESMRLRWVGIRPNERAWHCLTQKA